MILEADLIEKVSYIDAIHYIKEHQNTSCEVEFEEPFLTSFHKGIVAGAVCKQLQKDNARVATVLGVGKETKAQVLALCEACNIEVIKVYHKEPLIALNFCLDNQYLIPGTIIIPVNAIDVALTESDFVLLNDCILHFDAKNIPQGAVVIGKGNLSLYNKVNKAYSTLEQLTRNNNEEIILYEYTHVEDSKGITANYLTTLID